MNRNKNVTMRTAVIEIVIILFTMAGLFMVMVGGGRAYEAYASQFWPTTTGEILSARVQAHGTNSGSRTYHKEIKYAYVVDLPEYASEPLINERVGIDPAAPADSRAVAEAGLGYVKGQIVEVYYNPDNPESSLLEPSFSLDKLIYPSAGLLVLVVAFSLWIYHRRK